MKTFILVLGLFLAFQHTASSQLTGITPSQGTTNQSLNTTITGAGIFVQTTTPSGNIYEIKLVNGGYTISVFDYWNYFFYNTWVINSNSASCDISIPPGAPPGFYALHVTVGDPWFPYWGTVSYVLPDAFTVLPPDGYITGTAFDDLNKNGIKDVGEPGVQNHVVRLMPSNILAYTDALGNYSFPVFNGNYSVISMSSTSQNLFPTSDDTLFVNIANNNSSGNNFGLKTAMYSVTPSTGYKGVYTVHQLVSEYPIFRTGGTSAGNVSLVRVMSSPNISISSANVTVIDSFRVNIGIMVPVGTVNANNIDIRLYTSSGVVGYHYLRRKFNIATPPAFVSGTVFFDSNQNKLHDPGEPGIANAKVQISPDSSVGFSDFSGQYLIGSLGGQQVLSYTNNIPGLQLFTDSATYTFNAAGNITGKNFGLISTEPNYAVTVHGVHLFARCNTLQYLQFKVRNTSNIPYGATVWLKKSPNTSYFNASPPHTYISNDTIYWNIANISPYSEIMVSALLGLPGAGSSVNIVTGAQSLNGSGITQQIFSSSHSYPVFCAWDPNDKQCTPEGLFADHQTLMTDTLDYLIRFQNTGNDTAFKVVIVDTLDNHLDFGTFEITGNSHSMKTEMEKTGLLTFTMNNIMLPDSNVNEPASHGYIRYRVRAKNGLPDSTLVTNTAFIYFDFNPAVVTNTTFNTMVYFIAGSGPLPVQLLDFSAASRKEDILLRWTTASELNNDYFTVEKSVNGYDYQTIGIVAGAGTTSQENSYQLIDKNPVNGVQYYRLSQTDFNGSAASFEPLAVHWSSDPKLNVYPNPVAGSLFINISEDLSGQTALLKLIDASGKVVLIEEITFGNQLMNIRVFESTSLLQKGNYLLTMEANDKQYSKVIVVK